MGCQIKLSQFYHPTTTPTHGSKLHLPGSTMFIENMNTTLSCRPINKQQVLIKCGYNNGH